MTELFVEGYYPLNQTEIRSRPWPRYDGKNIEYTFRQKIDDTYTLGHDPVVVLRGEPGKSNTCHCNWRDGRFRNSEDVQAMADMLNAAAKLMRDIEREDVGSGPS